jgi:hypothetical protein
MLVIPELEGDAFIVPERVGEIVFIDVEFVLVV